MGGSGTGTGFGIGNSATVVPSEAGVHRVLCAKLKFRLGPAKTIINTTNRTAIFINILQKFFCFLALRFRPLEHGASDGQDYMRICSLDSSIRPQFPKTKTVDAGDYHLEL